MITRAAKRKPVSQEKGATRRAHTHAASHGEQLVEEEAHSKIQWRTFVFVAV